MSRILPGATIGLIGGGQLARMLALEGRRMGYRIAVLDPDDEGPAAQAADIRVAGALDDLRALETLARHSDVITLDTEHVPAEHLRLLEDLKPVRPSARVLGVIQDRLEQRRALAALSIPQVRHAPVSDQESLHAAAKSVGLPAVLKRRRLGYDGKGQAKIHGPTGLADAWRTLAEEAAVLESFVDFEREISVLLARGLDGEIRFHPVAENVHRHHILRTTRVPARISPDLASRAEEIGARIAAELGHVGMMAVEFFVTPGGGLLVNEVAPRTHNSGHYTFGACSTSQFEQHIRAICGLPLGDPALLRPAVMLNLLGDLWASDAPDWGKVLSHPAARLHLYGKSRSSPGRKMGHVLVIGEDSDSALSTAEAVAAGLEAGGAGTPPETPWTS